MKRRLIPKARVEHVEDVAAAENNLYFFHVTAIFASGTRSSKVVRRRNGVVKENTSLLRRVSILQTKSNIRSNIENIENIDFKTPKLQLTDVSTTPQTPTAYTAQIFDQTFMPTPYLVSAAAHTIRPSAT